MKLLDSIQVPHSTVRKVPHSTAECGTWIESNSTVECGSFRSKVECGSFRSKVPHSTVQLDSIQVPHSTEERYSGTHSHNFNDELKGKIGHVTVHNELKGKSS